MERTLIVDQLKLGYEGLFDLPELYRLIDSWFYEKGWDKYEHVNQEQVTSSGRQIRIVLEPWKSMSDYYKIIIRIKFHAMDVTDVEIEKDKQKVKLNQGELRMVFDGYVVSDRQGKWHDKPVLWFLSTIFRKYFFKDYQDKAERWLLSDLDDLYQKIKSFLNVHRYSSSTPSSQAEVRF
ncbi:MAG: hypothetical protein ABIA37_05060 [Candidatus Woesearchaeota archaeon]